MEKKRIHPAIVRPEHQLRGKITAPDLTELKGYSVFRFHRPFQSIVNMPAMQCMLKRRLLKAADETEKRVLRLAHRKLGLYNI